MVWIMTAIPTRSSKALLAMRVPFPSCLKDFSNVIESPMWMPSFSASVLFLAPMSMKKSLMSGILVASSGVSGGLV